MAEEKKNIDPNTVYISFTGDNKDIVDEFRKMLATNNIPNRSSRVKENIVKVSEFENEFRKCKIVVIFFSQKYFESFHCMNEYAYIREHEKDMLIYTVKCQQFDFKEILQSLIMYWGGQKAWFGDNVSSMEMKIQAAADHSYYLNEANSYCVKKLGLFFTDDNYYKPEELGKLVEKIKKDTCVAPKTYERNDFFVSSLPSLSFYTRTDIVPRPVEAKEIMQLFEQDQIVNLIGVGGCGKTTITESFVNMYGDAFYQKTGLFINYNYYREIIAMYSKIFNMDYDINGKDVPASITFNIDKMTYDMIIDKLELYPKDENRFNLLIIDINEFADYENIENALDDLRDNHRLRNWKILVVSREKMESARVHFDPLKLETDQVEFPVLEAIFNKYLKGDNRYSFTQEQLEALFRKLGHLPILIEHLAYYLRAASEVRSFDFIWKYLGDGFEDHKMWFRKYEKIREFLSLLMRIDSLDEISKEIVRLLVIWPTEYYSAKFIRQFMSDGDDSNPRFVNAVDDGLNTLVDKCVLDSMNKGKTRHYKIHDIISGQFWKQIFEDGDENEMIRSYSFYANIVKSLLKSREEIDSDTRKCIDNTPLDIFGIGSTKDYSVYEDWQFLRGLAKLKVSDGELSELSYKAYLLKKFYNNSGEEIYHKVYEEYENVSSHLLYKEWLVNEFKYNNDLPKEESDDYGKFITIPVNGVAFKMRKVKHGSFQLGSNDVFSSERPVHQVTLTNDFYIGEVQVTQQLWMSVMGENNNPSQFNRGESSKNHPVECVSWYDCMDFIIKLNELTKYKDYQFRLPTEAEWEYAARSGGKKHKYSWTDEAQRGGVLMGSEEESLQRFAWFDENSEGSTHPVATDVCPNELGIYDMSGNVWEWCQDWGADYSPESLMNPQGFFSDGYRVLRGGSWDLDAQSCRVSNRYRIRPVSSYYIIGFRLSLSSKHP